MPPQLEAQQEHGAMSLAERFWSIARAATEPGQKHPVTIVNHVLKILDALDRGVTANPVSVHTLSFLKLLRESETQGDLSYAAPEQLTGEELDERALVFSVGVLIFERLTGKHPFGSDHNSDRQLARIRKGEFGSAVNFFPSIPPKLRTILTKAMGPFPEQRWHNLDELRNQLRFYVSHAGPSIKLPGTTAARDIAPLQIEATAPTISAQDARDDDTEVELDLSTESTTTNPEPSAPGFSCERTRIVDMSSHVERERKAATARKRADVPFDPKQIKKSQAPKTQRVLMSVQRPAKPDSDLRVRSSSIRSTLVSAAIGGLIATGAFLALGESGSSEPSVRAEAPQVGDTQSRDSQAPAAPETMTNQQPQVNAMVDAFNPQREGARVAELIRQCIPPERLENGLIFGISVLYNREAGTIDRVFHAKSNELLMTEKRCATRTLLDSFEAATAPSKTGVVSYTLTLTASRAQARVMNGGPSVRKSPQ